MDKWELSGKDEEFMEGMLGLVWERMVWKNWNGRELGENGVVKGCMKMLVGERVKCEDERKMGNGIGGV